MAQPHEELLDSMLPERILGHLGLSLLLSPGDQIVDFAPFRKRAIFRDDAQMRGGFCGSLRAHSD